MLLIFDGVNLPTLLDTPKFFSKKKRLSLDESRYRVSKRKQTKRKNKKSLTILLQRLGFYLILTRKYTKKTRIKTSAKILIALNISSQNKPSHQMKGVKKESQRM